MEQAAWGGNWVTIPGHIQKTWKHGAPHGLVTWFSSRLGSDRLDLMILEIFSNLNDSMILNKEVLHPGWNNSCTDWG